MRKIKLVKVEKRFLLRRWQIPKRIKPNMTLQENLNSCTCHLISAPAYRMSMRSKSQFWFGT